MVTVLKEASMTVDPEGKPLGEVVMVRQERWQEIHRLFHEARVPIAEISRRLDLDRKAVRRCLRRVTWHPHINVQAERAGVEPARSSLLVSSILHLSSRPQLAREAEAPRAVGVCHGASSKKGVSCAGCFC